MEDIDESVSLVSGETSLNASKDPSEVEKGLKLPLPRRRNSFSILSIESIHEKVTKFPKWLMPLSPCRISWEILMFMAIWYNAVVCPLRLFIMTNRHTPSAIVSADIAFDLLFLMDTVAHVFLPVVDDDTGQVIVEQSEIRKKYLESMKFYVNAITCLPILKFLFSRSLDSSKTPGFDEFIIILRMIRIVHFKSQFRELKLFLSSSGPINDSFFRMGVILFLTLLMMSVFGCVYFGLSLLEISDVCPPRDSFVETFLVSKTWVSQDNVITDIMNPETCDIHDSSSQCNRCPQVVFFARSIYFLMQTLFTIGYGDSVAPSSALTEMVTACVFLLFGVFLYSLIIANMTSVLANFDVVGMRYRKEKDAFTNWMNIEGVSGNVKQQVHLFFSYIYRKHYGMLTRCIFGELPPHLKNELANLHIDTLCKVPFFGKDIRDNTFLNSVALVLEHRVHTPKSYILFPLELQRRLVIVLEGRAEVVLRHYSEAIRTLNPGDYYGDYQLLFGTINQVGILSPDFTETLSLSYEAFAKAIQENNQIWHDFEDGNGMFYDSLDKGVKRTIENYSA